MGTDFQRDLIALLPRLRRFAYALTGSLDDADDLVQSGCERALSRIDQFEPGTRLDSWMFRILQTTWIDRVRAVRRRPMVNDTEQMEAMPHDARIHERTEARAALGIVRSEIERLPEDQRLVLSLVAIDGMSYQDAASALEIPIGTVMSRLARARRKLGEALDRPPSPASATTGR